MARVEIPFVVQGDDGAAISGASVQVYTRGTTTPVPVYSIESGGSTVSLPLTTTANGRINGWVDEYQSIDLTVSGSGLTTYTQAWEVVRGTSTVGTSRLDTNAVTSIKITDAAVTTGKIADANITLAKLAASVAQALVPAGTLLPTARSTAATGYVLCDGSAINRTTYADLFAAISTTYGVGDGSTTFNIPDLRGRTPVGVDGAAARLSANDALGNTAGTQTHTLTTGEMPAHTHTYFRDNTAYLVVAGGAFAVPSGISENTGSTGGGGAHNNMQPYQIVNFMIKT